MQTEVDKILARYDRRKNISADRYSYLNPTTYMIEQEKERYLIKWIKKYHLQPLDDKKILEIGCGDGSNLQKFIRFGFKPSNIFVNELINERLETAKKNLPSEINYFEGNALDLNFNEGEFDIVFQSMVFSSILDKEFKFELAKKLWSWVKPGGGLLWYDFIYNNPFNRDVKGIPFNEVRNMFDFEDFNYWRITLAPPLSRAITKIHPHLYTIFNIFPFLRTHILCWLRKF